MSIIQNKSIWLSDANKTNDPSELNYIFNFFTSTIDECLEKYTDKYTNLIIQKVKAIANTMAYNLVYEKAPIARYKKNFICCFSEAKDLLSQWRAYGNDGNGVPCFTRRWSRRTGFAPESLTREMSVLLKLPPHVSGAKTGNFAPRSSRWSFL